jgi:hypothetical protein
VREYRNPEGTRHFCGRCGGRLFNRPSSTERLLLLVVATLDAEPHTKPIMHVNVESKAPWYDILDGSPQYPSLPPAPTGASDP